MINQNKKQTTRVQTAIIVQTTMMTPGTICTTITVPMAILTMHIVIMASTWTRLTIFQIWTIKMIMKNIRMMVRKAAPLRAVPIKHCRIGMI